MYRLKWNILGLTKRCCMYVCVRASVCVVCVRGVP